MFTNISWKEYVMVMTAALILYYVWLLFIFYARDILSLFKIKKIPTQDIPQNIHENESEEIFRIVYGIQDELRAAITDAGIARYSKQEIILSLQLTLQRYSLASTPFRVALNNFIERECENNCSIHLNEEELNQLWKGQVDGVFS